MSRVPWTTEELSRLVQSWRESLSALQNGGKAKKKQPMDLTQAVYERFEALAPDGAASRSAPAVKAKMDNLREAYAFIRNFQENKEMSGGVEWFSLLHNRQKKLMKNAGSKRVQPIDEKLFKALHDVFHEDKPVAEEGEDESDEETESDGNASDGDKFQRTITQKKAPTKKTRRATKVAVETRGKAAALAKEAGELVGNKQEVPKKLKRLRTTAPSSSINVAEVLEHQSQVLAGFLDERVKERTEERERSRQEREADQQFWAAETAKDRALLRELLTHK